MTKAEKILDLIKGYDPLADLTADDLRHRSTTEIIRDLLRTYPDAERRGLYDLFHAIESLDDDDLKRDLIYSHLYDLKDDNAATLVDLINAAMKETADNVVWRIYPMDSFDKIYAYVAPSDLAASDITAADMSKPYFCDEIGFPATTSNFMSLDLIDIFGKLDIDGVVDYYLHTDDDNATQIIKNIRDLDVCGIRDDVETLLEESDVHEIVDAFNSLMVDTHGCDQQIFSMADDLWGVQFDMIHENEFMAALAEVEESIRRGKFTTSHLFWEFSDSYALHSFTDINDSRNYQTWHREFIDHVILGIDLDGINEDTARKLDEIRVRYGIKEVNA